MTARSLRESKYTTPPGDGEKTPQAGALETLNTKSEGEGRAEAQKAPPPVMQAPRTAERRRICNNSASIVTEAKEKHKEEN